MTIAVDRSGGEFARMMAQTTKRNVDQAAEKMASQTRFTDAALDRNMSEITRFISETAQTMNNGMQALQRGTNVNMAV